MGSKLRPLRDKEHYPLTQVGYSCHSLVDAEKQMTVHRAPIALTVHLKRFTYNWRRGGMDKVSKHIEFPERLDLSPYMSQDTRKTAQPYHLYGVLVHMGGGCHSGHYYAYVKNANGKWYCMDDDDVSVYEMEVIPNRGPVVGLFLILSIVGPASLHSDRHARKSLHVVLYPRERD